MTSETEQDSDTRQGIASDQLDYLRENPGTTAWVSVHTGRHPWVRWNPGTEHYEIAETSGVGGLEIEACGKGALLNLFAENPVDLKPCSEATYSPPEPGSRNVWEAAEEGGENVIYASSEAKP